MVLRAPRLKLDERRSVVVDSLDVVRGCIRFLRSDGRIWRLLGVVIAVTLGVGLIRQGLFPPARRGRSWCTQGVGRCTVTDGRLGMSAVRNLVSMSAQLAVAGLFFLSQDRLPAVAGSGRAPMRAIGGLVVRALPALVVFALVTATIDAYAESSGWGSWLLAGISFAFAYVLAYAIPGIVGFGEGVLRAFPRSVGAIRRTMGADILAFSGLWITTGVLALVSAAPDALRTWDPTPQRGLVERLLVKGLVLLVAVPAGVVSAGVSAAFVCVVLYAVVSEEAPTGFDPGAVSSVTGLALSGSSGDPSPRSSGSGAS